MSRDTHRGQHGSDLFIFLLILLLFLPVSTPALFPVFLLPLFLHSPSAEELPPELETDRDFLHFLFLLSGDIDRERDLKSDFRLCFLSGDLDLLRRIVSALSP